MSEKLIIDLFQAIDSRDWNALGTIFHPEIVYERPGYKRFEGISQVMRFYEHDRNLVSGKHDTECIIVNGNTGACWGRFTGVKKDNSNADERFADLLLKSALRLRCGGVGRTTCVSPYGGR
jgi:ketosteroid isomerase-like protein